jgi:UDP-N-acetyl-D-glucosamine/UDP-N-acetyl-D-galactosamine dehydrogenase
VLSIFVIEATTEVLKRKLRSVQANSLKRAISVVGLGYVGLPVAVAFARGGYKVVGFDIDERRLVELRKNRDANRECSTAELEAVSIDFTANPADLSESDFFIVTVPTPIDSACRPDLDALLAASRTVGSVLRRGSIVVYESTVYPGATEEECVPVLEDVPRQHS